MRNDRRMDRRQDTRRSKRDDGVGLKGAIYIAVFLLILRSYRVFCNNKSI